MSHGITNRRKPRGQAGIRVRREFLPQFWMHPLMNQQTELTTKNAVAPNVRCILNTAAK